MRDGAGLDFDKGGGRVTVIAQDARTGAVLMVALADREAVERTIATGEMHYTSRTRGLWHKGATSGNVQRVVSLSTDCDGDALLARVVPAGPACHTGAVSCFGEGALGADALGGLARTIEARLADERHGSARGGPPQQEVASDPAGSPHHSIAAATVPSPGAPPQQEVASDPAGPPHHSIAAATISPPSGSPPSYTRRLLADRNLRLKKLGEETAELVVALADDDRERALEEGVDLLYHMLVVLRAAGVTLDDVRARVAERHAARDA